VSLGDVVDADHAARGLRDGVAATGVGRDSPSG
jgi:hypothetical protein